MVVLGRFDPLALASMEARVVFVSPTPILEELVALVPDPGDRLVTVGSYGHAIHVMCDHPEPDSLRRILRAAADGVTSAVITGPLATRPAGLVLCDVDSTFTTTEGLDLVARRAGRFDDVAKITERAMLGDMEFSESLRLRVAAVAGVPTRLLDDVRAEIRLSPGALELVSAAHAVGARVALTSGGFHELIDPVANEAGVDFVNANRFGTRMQDGVEVLSGEVLGDIVDRAQKARDLLRFAQAAGVDPALTVAAGDGANDLDMLAAAGLGVAYLAKPRTAAAADVSVGFSRLDALVPLALER